MDSTSTTRGTTPEVHSMPQLVPCLNRQHQGIIGQTKMKLLRAETTSITIAPMSIWDIKLRLLSRGKVPLWSSIKKPASVCSLISTAMATTWVATARTANDSSKQSLKAKESNLPQWLNATQMPVTFLIKTLGKRISRSVSDLSQNTNRIMAFKLQEEWPKERRINFREQESSGVQNLISHRESSPKKRSLVSNPQIIFSLNLETSTQWETTTYPQTFWILSMAPIRQSSKLSATVLQREASAHNSATKLKDPRSCAWFTEKDTEKSRRSTPKNKCKRSCRRLIDPRPWTTLPKILPCSLTIKRIGTEWISITTISILGLTMQNFRSLRTCFRR